ncbi:MAG: hypothetical protein H8E66_10815, partial [Planctomycetes bacterium]|nr:hypothetical protein [Planctomycetota bacterium]
MPGGRQPMMTRPMLVALLCLGFTSLAVADEPVASELRWNIGEEFLGQAKKANPNVDRDGEPTWHFLRTTGMNGPVESRQWLRDGKYVPLSEQGDKLFDSPLDGWAYRAGQRLAPLLGKVTAEYDVGLKFKAGDMLVAPGPEHAMVIGWRSPV